MSGKDYLDCLDSGGNLVPDSLLRNLVKQKEKFKLSETFFEIGPACFEKRFLIGRN